MKKFALIVLFSLAGSGCYAVGPTTETDDDITLMGVFLTAAQNFEYKGNKKIVEAFVSKNVVDINGHRGDGWTVAKCAARWGHIDMLKFLVENKADLNTVGSETVLDVACRSLLQGEPKKEMIRYLKGKGAKTNDELTGELFYSMVEEKINE